MGIELSNIKTIYKAVMIRVVWFAKEQKRDPRNKIVTVWEFDM